MTDAEITEEPVLLSLPLPLQTAILCLLPLDAALRFSAVSRASRRTVSYAEPQLWRSLQFGGVTARLDARVLRAALSCRAATAHTRELDVSGLLVRPPPDQRQFVFIGLIPTTVVSNLRHLPRLRTCRARTLAAYFSLPQICAALRTCPMLKLLDCDLHLCTTWGNSAAERQAALFHPAVQLRQLRIDGALSREAILDVCAALSPRRVEGLDLQWSLYYWNPAPGIQQLAGAAAEAPCCRSIQLQGYGHQLPKLCAALLPGIASNRLSQLSLRTMRLADADVLALLRAVADNVSLESLIVEPFHCLLLGSVGGDALGRVFAHHPRLETVCLPGLGLGPLGGIRAAAGLSMHSGQLKRLNLCLPLRVEQRSEQATARAGVLGDGTAFAVAEALRHNSHLRGQLHYIQLLEGGRLSGDAIARLHGAVRRGDGGATAPTQVF